MEVMPTTVLESVELDGDLNVVKPELSDVDSGILADIPIRFLGVLSKGS